jgi:hypothetical protein
MNNPPEDKSMHLNTLQKIHEMRPNPTVTTGNLQVARNGQIKRVVSHS